MSNGTSPPPRRHLEVVRGAFAGELPVAGLLAPDPSIDQLEELMERNPLCASNQREDYLVRKVVGASIESAIGRMAHVGRTMVHVGLPGREITLHSHPNPTGVNFTLSAYSAGAHQRHHATLLLPYNARQHAVSQVVTEEYNSTGTNQWLQSPPSPHIATNGELALAGDLWKLKHWAFGPQVHLGALASLGMPLLDSLKPNALKQVDQVQAAGLFMTTLKVLRGQSDQKFTPERPFVSPADDPNLSKQSRGMRAFVDSGVLKLVILNKGSRCWEAAELTSDGRTPPKLHTYILPTNPGGSSLRWEERPLAPKTYTVTQEQLLAADEIVRIAGGLPPQPISADQRRIAKEQWGFTVPRDFNYFQRQSLAE